MYSKATQILVVCLAIAPVTVAVVARDSDNHEASCDGIPNEIIAALIEAGAIIAASFISVFAKKSQ